MIALYVLAALYALWVFFLAVMNLKRVSELGKLSGLAKVLGLPIILVGYGLDVCINFAVMTVIFIELPRELTVSGRLERHNRGDGWRKSVAAWFEPLLDPFDPSGNHI